MTTKAGSKGGRSKAQSDEEMEGGDVDGKEARRGGKI
jgi:hypothetical protein